MRSVAAQLAAFRGIMDKDSAAQRGAVAGLVGAAAERGKHFVDATLQLSNVQALSAYLLGSKADARSLPIARGGARALNARYCWNPPPPG